MKQLKITDITAKSKKDEVDLAVAKMFYACGIPFNVARSDAFKEAVMKCVCMPVADRHADMNPRRAV
jgi:hypothetical protein